MQGGDTRGHWIIALALLAGACKKDGDTDDTDDTDDTGMIDTWIFDTGSIDTGSGGGFDSGTGGGFDTFDSPVP